MKRISLKSIPTTLIVFAGLFFFILIVWFFTSPVFNTDNVSDETILDAANTASNVVAGILIISITLNSFLEAREGKNHFWSIFFSAWVSEGGYWFLALATMFLVIWNRYPHINALEARFTLYTVLFAAAIYLKDKTGVGSDFRDLIIRALNITPLKDPREKINK